MTVEPEALTKLKNNPKSICYNCAHRSGDCSSTNKIIHKIKKDYFVKSCSSKEVER
jgi:hypothetical protein